MRYLVILEQRRLTVLRRWSEELKCHQWSCYVGRPGEIPVAGDPSVLMVCLGFPQTRYLHLRLRESSDRTQATSESLRPDLPEVSGVMG